ncbi:CsbD family protein [Aeromicrobium sp. Sec7.5]|uniref:CsbD family protein n=1 Tax=Aeromicrobium sp. Sec7.5 TaxID=3121276 RepID=UPI002FE48DE9
MGIVDKAKNTAEKLTGQGKEAVGDATNNDDLKAEGQKDQAKGSVKNAAEDVKDVFKK